MPKVRENEIDGKVLDSLKRDELMDDLEMPEHESEVEDSNFELSDAHFHCLEDVGAAFVEIYNHKIQ